MWKKVLLLNPWIAVGVLTAANAITGPVYNQDPRSFDFVVLRFVLLRGLRFSCYFVDQFPSHTVKAGKGGLPPLSCISILY
jgi:hypothetical protein